MQKIEYTLSTLEVAEMTETEHWQLLRKLEGRTDRTGKHVKGYIEIINDNHLVADDYFVSDTYKDAKGEERKCYQVTKLGCDFLANKFTGEKGVLFTARYVKRFHEMEEQLKKENHMDWYVNDIRVFQHREFGILRTIKLDGQDYFIGIDATRSLGYVNNTDALKKRVSNPEKCYVRICDGKMNRNMVAITRKGMDELVQTGQLPLAGKYGEWLQKQVYPMLDGREVIPVRQSVEKIPEAIESTTAESKEGFDIAPLFREVIQQLPVEALDEMEKSFRKSDARAVKLAAISILSEKMKRQIS